MKTMLNIWLFIKKKWYIFVGVLGLIVSLILFKKKNTHLTDVIEIARDSSEKRIQHIEESYEEENRRKREAEQKYQEVLEKLEKDYEIKKEIISEEKEQKIKDLIKENNSSNNRDVIARKIAQQFGITYIENERKNEEIN